MEGLGEQAWAAFEEGVRGRIFDVALARCQVEPTPAVVEGLVTCYRNHVPDIELLGDARGCLDRLRGRALAVITDGPVASQRAKATALGVNGWAAVAVFTGELGDGLSKPHRRAFELVEEATGHHGGACAYLADNPAKDFIAPRALGWVTARVRRPGGLHHGVPTGDDVDVELADLATVPSCLEQP